MWSTRLVKFINKNYIFNTHTMAISTRNSRQFLLQKSTSPVQSIIVPKMYSILAKSYGHANRLKQILNWRQSTSMPILRVLGYRIEPTRDGEYSYGQLFHIEIEAMCRPVQQIRNINLGQAMYLMREYLLGLQTLIIKFNCLFNLRQAYLGVTAKGEARVWISEDPLQMMLGCPPAAQTFAKWSVYDVLAHTAQAVVQCVKPNLRHTFQKYVSEIMKKAQLSFADAHSSMRKVCVDNGISLPRYLAFSVKISSSNQKGFKNPFEMKSQIKSPNKQRNVIYTKMKGSLNAKNVKKSSVESKIKFSYNSPSVNDQMPFRPMQQVHSKPKVVWSYVGSACKPKSTLIPKRQHVVPYFLQQNYATAQNSIHRDQGSCQRSQNKRRQFTLCRSVPIKIEGSNKQYKKPQIQEEIRQSVTIKEFNVLEEEDDCVDQVVIHEEVTKSLNIKSSHVTQNNYCLQLNGKSFKQSWNLSKKSTTTTQISNTQRGKDSMQSFKQKCYNLNRLEQMIDDSKPIMASILVSSPRKNKQQPESSRAYDFGGLIPIEKEEVSVNGEIEGKQVESLEASRNGEDQIIKSNQADNNSKLQWESLLGTQIKFYSNNTNDLKESVWCGEDKKAEHLQIKLQKLGYLGREICSSFVPMD